MNEKHGSIQHFQCLNPFCGFPSISSSSGLSSSSKLKQNLTQNDVDLEAIKEKAIWRADRAEFEKITRKIDYKTFRLPFSFEKKFFFLFFKKKF